MNPLITFIMPCRCRGNGPRTIIDFLSSVKEVIPLKDQLKMEFLIKFDNDDEAPLLQIKEFSLNTKIFWFNRWEGYNTLYLFYQYLFSKRNPTTKYVIHPSDDSIFTKEAKNFISDIEVISSDYTIINANEIPHTEEKLDQVKDYKTTSNLWASGFLTEPYPLIPCKIIEIMGNFGWQHSVDANLALLNIIMYTKYGINLIKILPYRHIERIDNAIKSRELFTNNFNDDMKITDTDKCKNNYLYRLIETQVDSIYLHMKKDGFLN